MSCMEPGEVVVLPRPGGKDAWGSAVLFATDDIFERQETGPPEGVIAPIIVEVPVGQEVEHAVRFGLRDNVHVAVPNFKVQLSGVASFVTAEYLNSIAGLVERDMHDGEGVSVGIIDGYVGASAAKEYDVSRPGQACGSRGSGSPSHGGVIAEIIAHIAPQARILSYAMGASLNIGSVVTALALARAQGPAIMNRSLAVSCDPEPCRQCQHPGLSSINVAQLEYLFAILLGGDWHPLVVASAGNNRSSVAMPARFDGILAVSAFETSARQTPTYVRHERTTETLLVAPGSLKEGTSWVVDHRSG